jgi:hypothetical protein
MKTALCFIVAFFTAVVLLYGGGGAAPPSSAEGVAAEIQKHIPQGWNCSLISPVWQNQYTEKAGDTTWAAGVHTEEANKAIAPLLEAIKKYFDGSTTQARHM